MLRFTAVAKDARGLPVGGIPVQFAVYGETAPEIIAAGAAAHITSDGRFVAERSGRYTVAALSRQSLSPQDRRDRSPRRAA